MKGDGKTRSEIAEGAEIRRSDRTSPVAENEIGAAIEVHRMPGPGLLESAYAECLCYELSHMDLPFAREVRVPVTYKGLNLDCGFKLDEQPHAMPTTRRPQ